MAGRADAAALPASLKEPYGTVRFFYDVDFAIDRDEAPPSQSNGWVSLQPQPKRPSTPGPHFGPELTFGRGMAEALTGETVGIIKAAYGGTNLAEQWDVDASESLCLYRRMLELVKQATRAEPSLEIAGFAWCQGESDAVESRWTNAYQENFKRLVDRLRKDLQLPEMPVVILEFARQAEADASHRTQEDRIVRDLETLAAADEHMNLVRTADLTMGDTIHWDAEGQRKAGRRLAREILNAK